MFCTRSRSKVVQVYPRNPDSFQRKRDLFPFATLLERVLLPTLVSVKLMVMLSSDVIGGIITCILIVHELLEKGTVFGACIEIQTVVRRLCRKN